MLEEKILEDYKKAMKDRDAIRVSVLSFLRSALKNSAIDKRVQRLDDADAITVLHKQIKQRRDSIEQFKKGNRIDLADKETRELHILQEYLPEQLSEDKIKELIEAAISKTGAVSLKDMGLVMKELLPQVSGRTDNKLVSELVRQRLSGQKE